MGHTELLLTDEEEMEFMVELCHEYDDLVRARFSSRHEKTRTVQLPYNLIVTNSSRSRYGTVLYLFCRYT